MSNLKKRIEIILDQAVKYLGITGLTWVNVRDDLEIGKKLIQESCLG